MATASQFDGRTPKHGTGVSVFAGSGCARGSLGSQNKISAQPLYTATAPASLSSSSLKAPPESTATVRMPTSLADSTSQTASPTATASSGEEPALSRASSKISGAGLEFSTSLELTIPVSLLSVSIVCYLPMS